MARAKNSAKNRNGSLDSSWWLHPTEESLEPVKARYPEIETLELPRIPDWVASLCVRLTFLGLFKHVAPRILCETILTFHDAFFLVRHGPALGL
jgi:hypothetical protein